jgi:outer membrane protein assembly factor BamA
VWERGTFILNRVFLGASEATPLWAGLDVGDANFLGTGLRVSGAFVVARAPTYEDGRLQWAMRLRYGDPSLFGLPLGASASFLYNRASEPEENPGVLPIPADNPDNYHAVNYRRVGGTAGVHWDVTRQLSLLADVRVELIDAEASALGWIQEGKSHLTSLSVGFEHDSRADPVLPQSGDYAYLGVEGSHAPLASDYDFARVHARWQHWFPVRGERHVVSLGLGAGAIIGRPPGFDLLYVSDFDRLLPPRALDLSVSTQAPLDVFGQSSPAPRLGTLGGIVEVEYRYRLFRSTRRVYGGDLFVGAGVFGLTNRLAGYDDRAFDLSFDLGVRLDTEIGIFEVSFANALGRLPL